MDIPDLSLTSLNTPHQIWLAIRSGFPHEWVEYFSVHGTATLCDEFYVKVTPAYTPNSFSVSTLKKGSERPLSKCMTIRSFCVLLGDTILLLRHSGDGHEYAIYGRIFLCNEDGFPHVSGPETYFSDRFDRRMKKLSLEMDNLGGHARKIEMMPVAKKSDLICELWRNRIEREKSFHDGNPYLQTHYIIPPVFCLFLSQLTRSGTLRTTLFLLYEGGSGRVCLLRC